jgi:hypothetical protein
MIGAHVGEIPNRRPVESELHARARCLGQPAAPVEEQAFLRG